MFTRLVLTMVALVATSLVYVPPLAAQDQPSTKPTGKPPQVEKEEIIRRGNMVQEVGTIQDGPIDIIAAALAPPADDSHKWFITVVTRDGDKYSERLKKDFNDDEVLRAWVNAADPAKSYCHYQVRRREDITQKDWFAKIATVLDAGMTKAGGPAIVIQPPKNGEFGPNRAIVAMLFGYDGDTKKLSDTMRSRIMNYVDVMNKRGLITHNTRIDYSKDGAKFSGNMLESDTPHIEGGAGQKIPIPDKAIDPFGINGPFDIPQPVGPVAPVNPVKPTILTPELIETVITWVTTLVSVLASGGGWAAVFAAFWALLGRTKKADTDRVTVAGEIAQIKAMIDAWKNEKAVDLEAVKPAIEPLK